MKRILSMLLSLMLLAAPVYGETAVSPLEEVVLLLQDPAGASVLRARMTADMQSALPEAAITQLMAQLEAMCGPFLGMKDDHAVQQAEGYTVHTQTLDMQLLDLTGTMALDGEGLIAGLNFQPAPMQAEPEAATPSSVTEEAVTVGEDPWALQGLLTVPASETPVPAVVLVHGSGPSDMDETAYALKPFRDIAAALSAQGIAVLRYDKRTLTHGATIAAGDMIAFSVEEETIQDAIAAGRLLQADPRIDPERIYVVGHSLGAMLAPRIVAESGDLFCGMVLLNGTNASLAEVVIQQNKDAVAAMPADQQTLYAPVIAALEAQAASLSSMTEEEAKAAQFARQSAYYFWEMLQHPTAAQQMTALSKPALIVNGSRDFQVVEGQGRLLWQESLDMSAPWLTCLWADVNHMLMKPDVSPDVAGTVGEYAVACTVAPEITDAIGAFINHTEE